MPEGSLQRLVGANVRRHRQALGLSQEKLGHEIGFDRTYIGSVERGERNLSLQSLEDLAARLGLDPMDLLRPL